MVLFSVQSFFAIPRSLLIQMNVLLHDLDHVPFSRISRQIRTLFQGVHSTCFSIDSNLTALEQEEVDELIAESISRSEFFYHVLVQDQWHTTPLEEDLFAEQLVELLGQSVRVPDFHHAIHV